MKKFFKYILPCMALGLALVSCSEDEKGFTDAALPGTVALENATAVNYNTVTANIVLSNPENVIEEGLEVATKEDFSDSKFIISKDIDSNIGMTLTALPATTYYIRAYAFQKNSNILRTEVVKITTPDFVYSIDGTYTVTSILVMSFDDYNFYESIGTEDYPAYEITIKSGEDGQVEITNLYEFGTTVVGFYDAETGAISVPSGQQVIDELDVYGPAVLVGFSDELDLQESIDIVFDKKTGVLETGIWGVRVSAGFWDVCAISAQHK